VERKSIPLGNLGRAALAAITWSIATVSSLSAAEAPSYWLDLLLGEQVSQKHVVEDLASANVIYVGETHTLDRHHETQVELLKGLADLGLPLALGMEQIEARHQAVVDRFNAGEIDFDGLAREMDWAKRWKNFEQYRALCEAAQKRGISIRGLNAPAELIREVGRGGVASLSPEKRKELPEDLNFEDPVYERHLNQLLAVHMSMDPAKLRTVFEAQVSRDEAMAENIAGELGKKKVVMVICGSGHVNFGLGTPDRVRRRVPTVEDRIVMMTESGELKLTPKEQEMKRDISISHGDLRKIGRPLADYLQVKPRAASE
jgi:uncharacterized iron-regulated protein